MEEKKEHWKAKEKRLREEANQESPVVTNTEAPKKSSKTEWSVVVGETVIHTYKLSDCEDAHNRAISLAAKKNGIII